MSSMLILKPLPLDLTWLWYAGAIAKGWLHSLLLMCPSDPFQRKVILLQIDGDLFAPQSTAYLNLLPQH